MAGPFEGPKWVFPHPRVSVLAIPTLSQARSSRTRSCAQELRTRNKLKTGAREGERGREMDGGKIRRRGKRREERREGKNEHCVYKTC